MDIVSRSRPRGVLANRSIASLPFFFQPPFSPFTTEEKFNLPCLVDRIELQTIHPLLPSLWPSFFKILSKSYPSTQTAGFHLLFPFVKSRSPRSVINRYIFFLSLPPFLVSLNFVKSEIPFFFLPFFPPDESNYTSSSIASCIAKLEPRLIFLLSGHPIIDWRVPNNERFIEVASSERERHLERTFWNFLLLPSSFLSIPATRAWRKVGSSNWPLSNLNYKVVVKVFRVSSLDSLTHLTTLSWFNYGRFDR